MTPESSHIVSTQTAHPRTIAAVHARVKVGTVGSVFGRYLDQVYAAARTGAVQLDGQNVFVYRGVPDQPNELDVAFGVGITMPFDAVGAVQPTELPVGEVATTTHWGSYARMREANDAIMDWCRAHGRRWTGVSWELYGHWVSEEARLRTDVFYLLEPA